MKISDETIRQLRRTQAQSRLPVYPAPDNRPPVYEGDEYPAFDYCPDNIHAELQGSGHYADAETEDAILPRPTVEACLRVTADDLRNRPGGTNRVLEALKRHEAERIVASGTVRNAPRMAVQSEKWTAGQKFGRAVFWLVCAASLLAFCVAAACAFVQ